ncbi:MAG: hypothetical protein RL582_120 [Bacteroidota bacterium]|jgi:integrase/recombinase XerC
MYLAQFKDFLAIEKRQSIHTQEAYLRDCEQFHQFIESQFPGINVQEVTTMMARQWMSHLIEESLAISSVHRKIASASAYYKFLMNLGVATGNPFRMIKKPKIPKRLPSYVDEGQTSQLYVEMTQPLDWSDYRALTLVRVLYETGIRRSELLGIQISEVDFVKGSIRVLGKRNKIRIVPISKELSDQMLEFYNRQLEVLSHENLGYDKFHWALGPLGNPMSKSQLYNDVKRVLSRWTTMRKKSPHVLRHSFATHMLNAGADLNVIKEILGHSSLTATQVYTHVNIGKLKGIHDKLHPRSKEK